jgi:hypothetical protein
MYGSADQAPPWRPGAGWSVDLPETAGGTYFTRRATVFINQEEREQLWATLRAQAEGPPSTAGDGITRDELIEEVLCRVEEFLLLSDDEVDLATFCTELYEYCDGPRPEVEILPQAGADPDDWPRFRLTEGGLRE